MKNKNLKIAFGAIGCALKFRNSEIKRSDGSLEYYKLLWTLVRNPSISEVVLLQKSDWDRLNEIEKIKFDPRGVLRDVYSDDEGFSSKNTVPASGINGEYQFDEDYKNLWEHLKDEKPFDFGLFFIGMGYMTNNSIPNFLAQVRDSTKKVKLQWVTILYCSPIVHFLNMSKTPWAMLALDPRYTKKIFRLRDTINLPVEIIAQYNQKCTWESIDKYEGNDGTAGNEISKPVDLIYTGIEKISRIGEDITPPDNKERKTRFMIVAMQSSYGDGNIKDERFDIIKEWILRKDVNKEVEIYGKWAEFFTKDWPQFKGFLHHTKVDEKFKDVKYTLVIPIRPNWVTSKWSDMLAMGVVAFLSPTYDTQYNVVPKDHFIRVKSPKDLYDKMDYLDKNPEKRISLVKSLQLKLLKDTKNGKFVFDITNGVFERQHIECKLDLEIDETVIRKSKSKMLF